MQCHRVTLVWPNHSEGVGSYYLLDILAGWGGPAI